MAEKIVPSKAEALMVDRRRRNETQSAAAARLQVPFSRYQLWERGLGKDAPRVRLGRIAAHERCLLMRLRCGHTQARVAAEMNVCRYWMARMERGEVDCTALCCHWES